MTKGQAIENFEILLQNREHTIELVQLWKVNNDANTSKTLSIIVQCKTTFQPSYCIVALFLNLFVLNH